MTDTIVRLALEYYGDPTTGKPISNSSVFIGNPDTDPEVLGNRKAVTLRQEDGTEVPITGAGQPLITGSGGYIIYNGSPVQVLTNGNYSIKVLRSNGSQAFFVENAFDGAPVTADQVAFQKATIAAATADDSLADNFGGFVSVAEYTAGFPINRSYEIKAGSSAGILGLVHNSDTASLFHLELVAGTALDARVFGYQNVGTAMSEVLNRAIAGAASVGQSLFVQPGPAIIDAKVFIGDGNPNGSCDGTRLVLMPGCVWTQTTTPDYNYMVTANDVDDVVIDAYGATLDGNIFNIVGWPAYGTTNLAGAPSIRPMNLNIGDTAATTNITVKGWEIKDALQDNVYMRSLNSDVTLQDLILTGAGRNNHSLVTGTNVTGRRLKLRNARQWFTDDFGYGIDIEPNAASEVLKNIRYYDCEAEENYDGGYNVLIANLTVASTEDVDIKFFNCVNDKSGWDTNAGAFHNNLSSGFEYRGPTAGATISTYIDFVKCITKNDGRYGLFITRNGDNLGRLTADIHCEDWNRQASSSPANVGAVAIKSLETGDQTFAVHLQGTMRKKDRVAGEFIITHASFGDSEYDNVWFGSIQVSGALDPRVEGVAGLTASNMLGSGALRRGPKSSFNLKPYAVHVAGTTQSIPNNVATALIFSTESGGSNYNFGRDFDLASDKWTPKEPGFYLVTVQHKYTTAVDNSRVYISMDENPDTGTFAEIARQESTMTTNANQNILFQQTILVKDLDFIYLVRALQATGASRDLNGLIFTATKFSNI